MKARTYVRPMQGWWRRNPFYRAYIVREATCFAVIAYALVLLAGLVTLVQGPEAFEAWRSALASPWSIGLHCVLLLLVAYHAWTWFKVMPKTLPFVQVGGRRMSDRAIITAGASAAVVASLALLFAVVAIAS
jgi:fumarate reductase subunit C